MKPIDKLIHCKHTITGRRDNMQPMYRCDFEEKSAENWELDNCNVRDWIVCPYNENNALKNQPYKSVVQVIDKEK